MSRSVVRILTIATLVALPPLARADRPYVVIRDDGTVQSTKLATSADVGTVTDSVLTVYMATGAPLPDFLSVWTTFPMGGDGVSTIFNPIGSEVTGIGLEQAFGAPFSSASPPLTSLLLHNDVTKISSRAAKAGAPAAGYASYLFLLELFHTWGPSIAVPGNTPDELEGFPVHWSFFVDAGGSPAGGNQWHDNADGTFSTLPQTPAGVHYSMLDLYLMGLASAMEVPPFAVLENPVLQGPSANVVDGLWGGQIAAHSFPWFGAQPVVVKATRRVLTMTDVIATNGMRSPAVGASPTSWKLGIVLVIGKAATDANLTQYQTIFDPIASSLAPAFSAATSGRGTLTVVTPAPVAVDGGITDAAPVEPADAAMAPTSPTSSGCALNGNHDGETGASWLFAAIALMLVFRRRPTLSR